MQNEQNNLEKQNLSPVKDWKRHVWLYAAILVLLGIGLAAWGIYEKQFKPDENDGNVACTLEAKICPDGSAVGRTGPNCEFEVCPVGADTTEWQTYRNEEYGFEFQYPPNFFVGFDSTTGSSLQLYTVAISSHDDLTNWQVSIFVPHESYYIDQLIEQETIIKVDGIDCDHIFTRVITTSKEQAVICNINGYDYLISYDDSNPYAKDPESLNLIYSQILSTFKFIDTTDISDWQTYRNEKYGFEVKYPEEDWVFFEQFVQDELKRIDIHVNKTGISDIASIAMHGEMSVSEAIEQTVSRYVEGTKVEYTENVIIAGEPAKLIHINVGGKIIPEKEELIKYYFFIHDDELFTISFWGGLGYEYTVFNRFLSTFRFIE